MSRKNWRFAVLTSLAIGWAVSHAHAQGEQPDLPPYKLVQSLQYVQDTIARGDLSALDVQKYMLASIDEQLRNIDPGAYKDTRNVDAALIYAMSGGNPDTLEYLVLNDAGGNFDIRVTEALRMYLLGKGEKAIKGLEEMVPEYKTSKIGPYLALIAANSYGTTNIKKSLDYFDWARLAAPGSNIEEAALRRSIYLLSTTDEFEKTLAYSRRYANRFLLSPYAGQFAEIFVAFVLKHADVLKTADIYETIERAEPQRKREMLLRIARGAALAGYAELASFASARAQEIEEGKTPGLKSLADLYSGLAEVPSKDVEDALSRITAIPDRLLSKKDRALRDAAKYVASEVTKLPTLDSLTQADSDMTAPPEPAGNGTSGAETAQPDTTPSLPTVPTVKDANSATAPGSAIDTFVSDSRSKLDAIDELLKKDR
jgi:chemotaxis protein MotC